MAKKKTENNSDFFDALEALSTSKGIDKKVFIDALEQALTIAYKKNYGVAKQIKILLPEGAEIFKVVTVQKVVEEVENRESEISLEDARNIGKYRVGDYITEAVDSREFGRIAAQTAKQVVMQKLREVESELTYNELAEKEDQIVTCIVRRIEGTNVYLEINKVEAELYAKDQLPTDRFAVGDKIRVYVKTIKTSTKGPQVVVSRTHPNFIKRLFELEVPEIEAGVVVIKGIVREAGLRTKISVFSNDAKVDAVGACVGNRGSRVNTIISEVGGEKIDIISWHEDILEYIARALMPAKVVMVEVNDADHSAKVVVMDDQLSLAIGRDGVNARLAAKLTGWKIDIKPYSAMQKEVKAAEERAAEEEKMADDDDIGVFSEDLGDLE